MAGKLVIDTLQDSSGNSTSATDAIKGSAKAWVNFNGVTTAAIRASYNVSSVTRNATGDYTVNFTNALADTNYAVSWSASDGTSTAANLYANSKILSLATSNVRVGYTTSNGAGGATDSLYSNLSIFR